MGGAAPESDKPLRFWWLVFFFLSQVTSVRGETHKSRFGGATPWSFPGRGKPRRRRTQPRSDPPMVVPPPPPVEDEQDAPQPTESGAPLRHRPVRVPASPRPPPDIPENAAVPGGGGNPGDPQHRPAPHSPHRRGLPAGPQPPPPRRAGQGRAGLGRAASRSHSQLLESPHSRHRTLQADNCPSPRSASLQALRGSGAGQPPRRSHRAASRTGNNRKGAGP